MADRAVPGLATLIARVRQRAFRHRADDADTVILRHSRIYILPTRRGLAVLGTLMTMLLMSQNYALSLGLGVTFLLTGLVGAALLATFRNLAGIRLRPLSGSETFAGAPIAFTIALEGRGTQRQSVAVRAAASERCVVEVPPDGRTIATLEVTPLARGRVPLGRLTIACDVPLGLWGAWAYVHFPLAGLAYPAPETGAPALPATLHGASPGAGGRMDDDDLAGLREYQRGDPLQRVAWKAVARGGGWYTKAFEGATGGGTLVLDWSALPATMPVEARLSRLCAWVLAGERAMRPYALRLPSVSLPAGLGREHRRAALTSLALFEESAR